MYTWTCCKMYIVHLIRIRCCSAAVSLPRIPLRSFYWCVFAVPICRFCAYESSLSTAVVELQLFSPVNCAKKSIKFISRQEEPSISNSTSYVDYFRLALRTALNWMKLIWIAFFTWNEFDSFFLFEQLIYLPYSAAVHSINIFWFQIVDSCRILRILFP